MRLALNDKERLVYFEIYTQCVYFVQTRKFNMELNPSANISVCITSMKTEIVKKDVIDEIQFILIFEKM